MNKKKKIIKRFATLIIVTIVTILTFVNMILSAKMFVFYDNLCITTGDYESYRVIRNWYFAAFFLFEFMTMYLTYMLVRYRGKMYDKCFRAFKVYGIIDTGLFMDESFVTVVFERKGKYYKQEACYETNRVKRFIPIQNVKAIEKLSLYDYSCPYIKKIPGETELVGYKYDNNHLIITTEQKLNKFLSNPKSEYNTGVYY